MINMIRKILPWIIFFILWGAVSIWIENLGEKYNIAMYDDDIGERKSGLSDAFLFFNTAFSVRIAYGIYCLLHKTKISRLENLEYGYYILCYFVFGLWLLFLCFFFRGSWLVALLQLVNLGLFFAPVFGWIKIHPYLKTKFPDDKNI